MQYRITHDSVLEVLSAEKSSAHELPEATGTCEAIIPVGLVKTKKYCRVVSPGRFLSHWSVGEFVDHFGECRESGFYIVLGVCQGHVKFGVAAENSLSQ